MWRRVAKLCRWERPQAPEVRLLFDDARAVPAALSFLRDARVGRIDPLAIRERWAGEDGREDNREGEEGGLSPPSGCTFPLFFVQVFLLFVFTFFFGEEGGVFLC